MVEIIPKPAKKIPRWQIILFYFSVLLTIMTIFAYFVLSSLEKSSEKNIQELTDKISQGKTAEVITLEKEILAYKKKIDDISPYIEQHILSSQVFDFLEKHTHPRTFFSKITLSSKPSKVLLSGLCDSFLTLGQQLMILDEAPQVKMVELNNIFLAKKGGIEFDLEMTLDSNIFKHHCGNGILEEEKGEECDDGNNMGGDGCSVECTLEELET